MTQAETLSFYSQSQRVLRNTVALFTFSFDRTLSAVSDILFLEIQHIYLWAFIYVLQTTHTHTWHPTKEQVSHMKCQKTCFSFFSQINQASATAEHTERFAVETNTIACHAVALVCKQELVCVVCVRWSVLRRSAPCQQTFTRVYTDVPLWADGCVFGTTNNARPDLLL